MTPRSLENFEDMYEAEREIMKVFIRAQKSGVAILDLDQLGG
jgi:hypothetical protein